MTNPNFTQSVSIKVHSHDIDTRGGWKRYRGEDVEEEGYRQAGDSREIEYLRHVDVEFAGGVGKLNRRPSI
jgi:hypothetical protein